jgi:hypothetical protein
LIRFYMRRNFYWLCSKGRGENEQQKQSRDKKPV